MLEAAIDAGADDVASSEDGHEVLASPETYRDVAKALEGKFGDFIIRKLGREIIQPTQAGDIRNGLDVKNQDWLHAGKTPVDK